MREVALEPTGSTADDAERTSEPPDADRERVAAALRFLALLALLHQQAVVDEIAKLEKPRLVATRKLTVADRARLRRDGRNPDEFEVGVFKGRRPDGTPFVTRVIQAKGTGRRVKRRERGERERRERLARRRDTTPPSAARSVPQRRPAEHPTPAPRAPRARRASPVASTTTGSRSSSRDDPSGSSSAEDPPLEVIPARRFRAELEAVLGRRRS